MAVVPELGDGRFATFQRLNQLTVCMVCYVVVHVTRRVKQGDTEVKLQQWRHSLVFCIRFTLITQKVKKNSIRAVILASGTFILALLSRKFITMKFESDIGLGIGPVIELQSGLVIGLGSVCVKQLRAWMPNGPNAERILGCNAERAECRTSGMPNVANSTVCTARRLPPEFDVVHIFCNRLLKTKHHGQWGHCDAEHVQSSPAFGAVQVEPVIWWLNIVSGLFHLKRGLATWDSPMKAIHVCTLYSR